MRDRHTSSGTLCWTKNWATGRHQSILPLPLFLEAGGACRQVGLAGGHLQSVLRHQPRWDYDHLHHHLIWLHRGGGLRNVRETWVGCGLAVAIKAETVRRGWTFTRKQCRNCQWRGLKVCGPPRFFVGRGCRSPTWRLCGLPQSSSMFPSCL